MVSPPAGAAALLGYLKANGIEDCGFLDLRIGTPACYEATYSATGVFGESFVMDIPDLPLVLQLLATVDSKRVSDRDRRADRTLLSGARNIGELPGLVPECAGPLL